MWSGFEIDRIDCESSSNIQKFIDHINILVNHNCALFEFLIKLLAQIVQQPGHLIGIAPVFVSSREGVGKNLFFDLFMNMLGKIYYFETANPKKDLFGRFSNARLNRLVVCIDETQAKDTFAHSEEFKSIITSTHVNYEKKGVDQISVTNYSRIFCASNNSLVVKITPTDRRFVVFECSNEKCGDCIYFNNLIEYMNSHTNQKAIIEYLRSIDISSVNWIKDRPLSEAYLSMQSQCTDLVMKYLEHVYLQSLNTEDDAFSIPSRKLLNEYIVFLKQKLRLKDDAIGLWNETSFGKKLKAIITEHPLAVIKRNNIGSVVVRCYCFKKTAMKTMLESNCLLTEVSYMFLEDDNTTMNSDNIDL
jgi:hypothetical protein